MSLDHGVGGETERGNTFELCVCLLPRFAEDDVHDGLIQLH